MAENKFEGFRKDGDKIMKGAKAIGTVQGTDFLQEKSYPRHYLRKHKGFGVSIGLLYLLLSLDVFDFNIEVVKGSGNKKITMDVISEKVSNLVEGKKIHYPGFDEQRVFKWSPEWIKSNNN